MTKKRGSLVDYPIDQTSGTHKLQGKLEAKEKNPFLLQKYPPQQTLPNGKEILKESPLTEPAPNNL
jgi:hypothetical protein